MEANPLCDLPVPRQLTSTLSVLIVAGRHRVAFNDDEKPTTSAAGSAKGLVTIKRPVYSKPDVGLMGDTVTAVIELNATSSTAVREELDLVVVLDVSSHMEEEKIINMKKAMKFVIMKLTPADRLCIVTCSDGATRQSPLRSMTQAAQKDLTVFVDEMDCLPRSLWTNIQAGLETALAVLGDRVHIKTRASKIFLMSDGNQNDGDARLVDPGNVSIYTFGFGKQDTDHQLLTDVAKKSPEGTFSAVQAGGTFSIAPFSQLLAALLSVVAQDVQLTLTPRTDEGELDTMVVPPGEDYTQTTDRATGAITINFGTLFSGEVRQILINLTLLPSTETLEYDAGLAEAQHNYTIHGKQTFETPVDIEITRTWSTWNALEDITQDDSQKEVGILRRNIEQLVARMDLKQLQEALQAIEKIVASKPRKDIQITRTPRRALAEAEDGQDMMGMLCGELQQLLELMGSASETSHSRQRYAARGDDADAVRLFSTPRMDAYLDQAKRFEKDPTTQALPTDDDGDVKEEPQGRPYALGSDTYHIRDRKSSGQR